MEIILKLSKTVKTTKTGFYLVSTSLMFTLYFAIIVAKILVGG